MADVEIYRWMRDNSKKKREGNRKKSAEILRKRGISFEEKNNGAHLIVEGPDCKIDFWPGTGRWNSRNGKKGFGVKSLLGLFRKEEDK